MPSRLAPASLLLGLSLAATAFAQAPRPQPRLLHVSPPGGRAGTSSEVAVGGEAIDAADGLWFSHPGISATPVAGKPRTFKVAVAAGTPIGSHDVRALTPDGLTNPRTFVVGVLPETSETEPNNAPGAASPIGINTVANGTIAAVDVDCFAFVGKKGQRLFANLTAERIDSPLDATVRLLDARGVELAESRDAFGADPFLDVSLPADGRYILKVHDVTYAGSADHVYRLTLREGPYLDAALPAIAAPGPASDLKLIGRSIGGTPLPGRIAGRPIEAKAWAGVPGFLAAPELPVNLLATASALRAAPLRVGPADNPSSPVLLAEAAAPVVAESEPNGPEAPQSVVPPLSIGGTFDRPGDLDVYRFAAKKGETWRIEAIAEGIGSPADPSFLLQRVPESGEPQDVATADDTPDPGLAPRFNLATIDATLRWAVPADGTYQVLLGDVASSSRGDLRLAYKLAIRRERPDFRLYVVPNAINGLDATTVRKGGRAGAVVLAWRLDGFNGPIFVRAEGLPEAVHCDPVVIPAGANSAPLVFEAETSATPSVGLARIVGLAASTDVSPWSKDAPPGSWLGPDLRHEAIPGSIVRPPPKIQGVNVTVTPARATRGFPVAVREGAPFLLTAKARRRVVAQGQAVELDVAIEPGTGFDDAVALGGWEAPAALPPPSGTIAKGSRSASIRWAVPPAAAPGVYTIVVKGTSTYLPDPKGKAKFKVEEPSNPVVVAVRPAPIALAIVSKATTLKAGEGADVELKIERRGKFAGPVAIALDAPESAKLRADGLSLSPGEVAGKLVVRAAKESPIGPVAATLRAEVIVDGDPIEVAIPLPLTIAKP